MLLEPMLESSPDWALILGIAGPMFVAGWIFHWIFTCLIFNGGSSSRSSHQEES